MRAPSPIPSDAIDPKALVTTVRRALPKLIALSLLAGVLSFLTLASMTPRYTAEAVIAITPPDKAAPSVNSDDWSDADGLAALTNERSVGPHIEALKSPPLLAAVANDLHLHGRHDVDSDRASGSALAGLLRKIGMPQEQGDLSDKVPTHEQISKQLSVFADKEPGSIVIRFTSTDPKLAAAFPNRLASRYRVQLAQAARKQSKAAHQQLVARIAAVRDELHHSEEQISALRTTVELLRSSQERRQLERQEGNLPPELIRARAARSATEARAKAARTYMREGTPELIPEVRKSRLFQDLIAQRSTIDRDLLTRSRSFETSHPVMKRLKARLSAVNRLIAREVANIIAGLDKVAFVAADREQAIAASLPSTKPKALSPPPDTGELRRLETVASTKRSELAQLQEKLKVARIDADKPVSATAVHLIAPALTPISANFPHDFPYTPFIMIATLLLGATIIITFALAKRSRHSDRAESSEGEAEDPLRAPSLPEHATVVATQRQPPPSVTDETFVRSQPAQFHDTGDLAKHLLQVSQTSETGFRTLIATQLEPLSSTQLIVETACQLTRFGKQALIIDWSLEGNGIARHLSLPKAPGFIELLQGQASFADVVRWIPETQVHFIASGRAIAEGPNGLDADQLNLLLDALDEAYDHIVIAGKEDAARTLFETIQGRFDAGILIADGTCGKQNSAPILPNSFLGFEVADIDLIQFECTKIRPENVA